MYQKLKRKSVLAIRKKSKIYFQRRTLSCIIIFSFLFIAANITYSNGIHHNHPPPIQIVPPPPKHFLEKAYFLKWKSKDVIQVLEDEGLEIVEMKAGITIGVLAAIDSIFFLTPSYGEETGGVISSYDSESKLSESITYYSSMNTDPQYPVWWIFTKDNILLLISGKVPEEKAWEYEKALYRMGERKR